MEVIRDREAEIRFPTKAAASIKTDDYVFLSMAAFNSITGSMPARTIVKAAGAHSTKSSSDAYWYTNVANVSKLNGRSIKVAGNSFIVSTKTRIDPAINAGLKRGIWIRHKVEKGPLPRVLEAISILGVIFSRPLSTDPTLIARKRIV